MIQIKGTNINNIECYLLTIRKKSFLFFSKPNLSNLRHFVNVAKNPVQKQANENRIQQQPKLSQKADCDEFSKLKVHLDINYIKQICKAIKKIPDQPLLHLMITDYQEFLILPYIYRKFKNQQQMKILCTYIAYEMGRIYLKRFFDRVFHFDLLYSDPQGLSYEEQSKIQDQFYIKYGVEIKTWVKLFTKEEMTQCLKLANKMNYGQIYDSDGVKLRSFPSGHSSGSCFWMFENTLTKETVMFIRKVSNQSWRSISQNHLINLEKQQGFRQKDYQNVDLLILANSCLLTDSYEKPEAEILKLMKSILQNMEKGINTEVVLEDELIILDIIDYINFEMKDKFRGIIVQNPEFNQMVSYANSYVQFLSAQYKNKIYQDPPEYPFEKYLILKQKGFLVAGSLYENCEKQKIPLKQLMRRSSPYIHFKSDFDAYLSGLKDEEIKVYAQKDNMSEKGLAQILLNLNPKKIISYANILPSLEAKWSQNTAVLNYGKQFVINSEPYNHYISKNISPNIINKYEFVEGFLMAYPVNREFLRFNSAWKEEILRHLKNNFIPVLQVNDSGLKTKHTHLWIQNYEIFLKSSNLRQIQFLLQIISQITKTLKLK